MIEYLFDLYVKYTEKAKEAKNDKDNYEYAYYDAKADLALTILQDRFGFSIQELKDDSEIRYCLIVKRTEG